MPKGYLIFELTCHLPFVKSSCPGEYSQENWLNDAVSNTYLPLLRTLHRMDIKSVPFRLTFTISPTLASMLSDPILQERFVSYLDSRIALGEKEVERTASEPEKNKLAKMYLEAFLQNKSDFIGLYGMNILNGFNELQKNGKINLITTFAAHCYLPFFQSYKSSIEAQIYTAISTHNTMFNSTPKGFWLPELGYCQGIEDILKKFNIDYFFTAVHAFLFGSKVPSNGIYAPVQVGDSGIYAFCRDLASSMYVLSQEDGYPGDFSYREYSRDISGELDADYLGRDIVYPDGSRVNSGFKYYSNTDSFRDAKHIYDPDKAAAVVKEHAENFIYNLKKRVKKLLRYTDRPPVIVCPYDAQVFGHWWLEGIDWLETVINELAADEDLALISPEEYLAEYDSGEKISLSFSSCGNGGYSGDWLNGSNDWIYRHIYSITDKMTELANRFPDEGGLKRRALNHAAREVLLAQASDWPFIMKSGIAAPFAAKQVKEHVTSFLKIYNDLSGNSVDTEWLTTIERKDSLFPDIDYHIFRG